MSPTLDPEITLARSEDGLWVARNPELGVTTQRATREIALEILDEAVAGSQPPLVRTARPPFPTPPGSIQRPEPW